MSDSRLAFVAGAGRQCIELATFVGGIVAFLMTAVRATLRRGFPFRIVVLQVYEIGLKSLPLTAIASFAIGVVLALQTLTLLRKFGVVHYVAVVVGLSVTKELGPVVTALMVAGRAGSGISAELGSMKVTRQIDALQVLAVDPRQYLVATRILACVIAVPLLAAISDLLGIIGGALVAVTAGGVPPATYVETTLYYVTLADLLTGLGKTLVFGLIIGTTAAFYGFRTEGGTSGVGRSTTNTVVAASLMIFITDVFMTQILVALGY
jgi:phospholipid/cholesterol/gamma-HCH transport system permease protein